MNFLFYNPWPNEKKWLDIIKIKFKNHNIYTLKDKFNYLDIDAAIIWCLPNKFFSKLNNLKIIFSLGAGVDHILNLPSYNNTPIVRIKDSNMSSRMSNYALSQVLNYQLKLSYYNIGQQKKIWLQEKETLHNYQIKIGILGVGYIGIAVGKFLQKLNYQVIGFKNSLTKIKTPFPIYKKNKLNNFIKENYIIISILPSTIQTFNFIDKVFLNKMKKNSFLINIGRGNSINEKDLIFHLKKYKNFFACLDVFKKEPLSKKNKFWKLPNVIITPHIAGITDIESSVNYIHTRFLSFNKKGKIKSDVNKNKGY